MSSGLRPRLPDSCLDMVVWSMSRSLATSCWVSLRASRSSRRRFLGVLFTMRISLLYVMVLLVFHYLCSPPSPFYHRIHLFVKYSVDDSSFVFVLLSLFYYKMYLFVKYLVDVAVAVQGCVRACNPLKGGLHAH